MKSLMTVCLMIMVGLATSAVAQQKAPPPPEKGTRIYQTDPYGRVQHNQPSWVVKENGRLVEVSRYGSEQSHKQQYVIKDNRVYHADFAGRVQHNKPSYSMEENGRVIQNSPYGQPQYNQPQYVVEGSKVYAADAYGRPTQQAYKIERKTPPGPRK